jgi:hypothetical protein
MSFMGFAPVDDPQVVIYCVIDRPNVADQPHSTLAQDVVRDILTEALPYLHIYRTEELTEEEIAELTEKNLLPEATEDEEALSETEEDIAAANLPIDPETGLPVDPTTGEILEVGSEEEDEGPSSDLDGLIGIVNDPEKARDEGDANSQAAGFGNYSESATEDYDHSQQESTGSGSGIGAGALIGGDGIDIEYSPGDSADSPSGGGSGQTSDFGAGVGL